MGNKSLGENCSFYPFMTPWAKNDVCGPRHAERKTGVYARCHYGTRFAGRRVDELRRIGATHRAYVPKKENIFSFPVTLCFINRLIQ